MGSPNKRLRLAEWPRKNLPEHVAERQEILRRLPGWHAQSEVIFRGDVPLEAFRDQVEMLTGAVTLPVSVVGPMAVDLGHYTVDEGGNLVQEDRSVEEIFVPLAHTEGGLAASLHRGALATAASGGVRTLVLADRMTRDSCFVFRTAEEAHRFSVWVEGQAAHMKAWLEDPSNPLRHETVAGVSRISTHARLHEVFTHVIGNMCHVLYRFTTGDACGPNMITRNAYALNRWYVQERWPGPAPERIVLEANMGGDKKESHAFFQDGGHGKTVIAETHLTRDVLRRVLHTTPEDLAALATVGLHGSHASGMRSFAFTPASAVAAIFAATGQDLGMVGTSSMAHATIRADADGAHISLRFSGLEVGTVGGGTHLPHAAAYLRLMGCVGPGSAYRLAQMCAAAALCLDVSAAAAMASEGSERFYHTHLARGSTSR